MPDVVVDKAKTRCGVFPLDTRGEPGEGRAAAAI
jgi:hypothetical protein